MWYQNFDAMFNYQANVISENTTSSNFTDIGNITLSEMGTLPFIYPYYKGQMVQRESMEMCKEFDGDCFKFIKKYLKIEWINSW